METALPRVIQEITDLIGESAALKIVSRCGGRMVDFSAMRNELAALIGLDETRLMVARFRSVNTYVPMCRDRLRAERNNAMRARFDALTDAAAYCSARKAVALLSQEFRTSDRNVWRILKKAEG